MGLLWEDRAWEEYLYWQTQDKKTLKRLNAVIRDIQRDPTEVWERPNASEEISADGGADALTK